MEAADILGRSMRRALMFLLALVLLAQFNWASAAAYCQHERSAAVSHWGHHEHAHPDQGQKKPADSKLATDADCHVCHASCVPPLQSQPDVQMAPDLRAGPWARATPPPPSAPHGAPERPQWPALA